MCRRAVVFEIMVLAIIEVHKAFVDRGTIEASGHAVGNFSNYPAFSFHLSNERHIPVVEGKAVVG